MNNISKIHNAFSIIITSDKEQAELASAYLDNDWIEIGRIISLNINITMANDEVEFREALNRALGNRHD